MQYGKFVSRGAPGLITLVLDDSGSMADNLPGTTDPKHTWVERLVGVVMKELLARCTEMQGNTALIKPRYFLQAILYGSQPQQWGTDCMTVEEFLTRYAQAGNSLGLGGKLGGTDAAVALEQARDLVAKALAGERFQKSFPPMVFHLTDSESQTDASQAAEQIKQIAVEDGNALLVNAYIGTSTSLPYAGPEDFPGYLNEAEAGPDSNNIRMFRMSSVVPATIHKNLVGDGIFPKLREGSRFLYDVRTKEMLKHCLQVVQSIPANQAC
jgi:hypothetical protein